jgi:hypothetical protein
VREDPRRRGLLFAGTEAGVYFSLDEGAQWQRLKLNLPTVPVHDLAIAGDDLVVATHGRAFWILDDLEPLRQLSRATAAAEVTLLTPQPGLRMQYPEGYDRHLPGGENPPPGAIIDYVLKARPSTELIIEVLDAQGAVVRTLSSRQRGSGVEQPPEWPDLVKPVELLPDEPGMNRYAWDLRVEAPTELPGAFYGGLPPRGPQVVPGRYTLRLRLGAIVQTAPLEVRLDPRSRTTVAALQEQYRLGLEVRARMSALHEAVLQLRTAREQLGALTRRAGAEPRFRPLVARAEATSEQLTLVERKLVAVDVKSTEGTLRFPVQLNEQFDSLRQLVESADTAPVPAMRTVLEGYDARLQAALTRWGELRAHDVEAIEAEARRLQVPALGPGH